MLVQKLREALKSFAITANKMKAQLLIQHIQVANAIISRIFSKSYILLIAFPVPIPYLEDFLPKLPRNILLNRQAYESIFAMLQCHPCYIIQLINEHFFKNKTEFVRFVKALYNKVNNMSNSRVIHLLTCLANNLIKLDMPYIDINEIHQAIKQTYFYPVFKIIFKSQKCNKKYTQIFVKILIDEIIAYSERVLFPRRDLNKDKEVIEPGLIKEDTKKNPGEENNSQIKIDIDPENKREENPFENKENGVINLIPVTPPGLEEENSEINKKNEEEKKKNALDKEKPFFYAFNLEKYPSKEKQKDLKEIMKKLKSKIKKSMSIGEQQSNRLEERTFSCEIIWLLQKVKKALVNRMNKDKNEEERPFFESQISSLIICKNDI